MYSCSKLAFVQIFVQMSVIIFVQILIEYNDKYRAAYFDTMLHTRKEKTHQISLRFP